MITRQEYNYLIKMLNSRIEELKQQQEIIKKRKTKGIDNAQTYLKNMNNNNLTIKKVTRLKNKLIRMNKVYVK